jgi:hypothetical protein
MAPLATLILIDDATASFTFARLAGAAHMLLVSAGTAFQLTPIAPLDSAERVELAQMQREPGRRMRALPGSSTNIRGSDFHRTRAATHPVWARQ